MTPYMMMLAIIAAWTMSSGSQTSLARGRGIAGTLLRRAHERGAGDVLLDREAGFAQGRGERALDVHDVLGEILARALARHRADALVDRAAQRVGAHLLDDAAQHHRTRDQRPQRERAARGTHDLLAGQERRRRGDQDGAAGELLDATAVDGD